MAGTMCCGKGVAMKVEIEVDVPDGWKPTGEFRKARRGDRYLATKGLFAWTADVHSTEKYIILERIEPKRESRWRLLPTLHSSPSYSYLYPTLADAKRAIGCNHNGEYLRMERLDYEDGKLVAVTLDPEGEA